MSIFSLLTQNATSGILRQLASSEILNFIDENTDARRKKSLTWDVIFKNTEVFVEKELDSIALLTSTLKKRRQVQIFTSVQLPHCSLFSKSEYTCIKIH